MTDSSLKMSQVVETQEIIEMIPHRPPFLFIDKVKDIVPNVSAVGIKNVTINEPFFKGHFPGHPIMPGVLVVEAMAQTSAVLVIRTTGNMSGKLVYFTTIEKALFRKPVIPGDQIHLQVEKKKHRGNIWKFIGKAFVDGHLTAEANFSAMIMDS